MCGVVQRGKRVFHVAEDKNCPDGNSFIFFIEDVRTQEAQKNRGVTED
ncbi:hypothetical protein AA0473_0016 [Acetobacter orleanensis NRIC 0473]|nr:hypothetical protein Abol_031_011 [Acetobacter orleanensis JCM 7639]GBR22016.1 hypothetical protein AA0473_0016 [Acetobacter orleanensis NRIC 0473]